MNLKERGHQLKIEIPALFLSLKSKDTPAFAKVLAGLAVAYALSPIDLIPDFIPVLGYLDDIIILPFLIALTIKFIPREVMEQFREEAKGMWEKEKPQKWYFAIPIIAVWMLLFWVIVKAVIFS